MGRLFSPDTEEEVSRSIPLPSPNLIEGELYWLSTTRRPGEIRQWADMPVRANRVERAAREAARWCGRTVLVWQQRTGAPDDALYWEDSAIVWSERPTGSKPRGVLRSFVYVP